MKEVEKMWIFSRAYSGSEGTRKAFNFLLENPVKNLMIL
jgi:hypothetical protein